MSDSAGVQGMIAFTEKVLFSSLVKLDNEIIKLCLVQHSSKECCLFLFGKDKLLFRIISRAPITNIVKDGKYFSWQIQGITIISDLQTLEVLLKANLEFESQTLFHEPFEWVEQYIIVSNNTKLIKEQGQIDHVKYTIQKIRENALIATYETIKVWVGTWNVNSQTQFPSSLDDWILNDDYDLLVFGFQELDTSTEAYLVQDSKREEKWSALIGKTLTNYSKIVSKQLVGMLILVYIKSSHEKDVSQVNVESLGTGLLGMMGNKGAVGVRFLYKDSHFCFVNSHLAADAALVERRNQDFKDICNKLDFPLNNMKDFKDYCLNFPWIPVDWSTVSADTLKKTQLTIFDVDHLIWLGDLNYRVSASEEFAKEAIRANQLDSLFVKDQLSQEIKAQRAFKSFREGQINFAPTYKFETGTNHYYDGEKQRTPSWCDRILWHQNPQQLHDDKWLNLIWYKSAMNFQMSDHKPVMALFNLKIRSVDYKQFQKTVDTASRELDILENASLPTIKISQQQLSFGQIRYGSPKICSFIIENTGTTTAQFLLTPKPDSQKSMHPWVHISHETGTVIPAQQVQVFVTLLVNQPEQSKILTYGTAQLNDILVIRVLNSSDYFVTIDAEWLPSVLGLDIPFLSLLKKPLRSYTVSEYAHLKTQIQSCGGRFSRIFMPETVESDSFDNALDPSIRYSIPKPIWIIIDFIYQMGEPIEMEIKGHHGLYQYLNECLCHGVEISSEIFEDTIQDSDLLPFNTSLTPLCSKNQEILDFELKVKSWKINRATALATGLELLFDFLSAIPEPIIPYSFYNRVLSEGYQSISAAKSLLYQIPTLHYNLFIYLCSFFKQWFKRDKKGTIKANMLNKLANILVREPLQSSYMSSENSSTRSKKLAFISHFI